MASVICTIPKPISIYYESVVSPDEDLVRSITNEEPIMFENAYGVRPRRGIHNQSVVRFYYQYNVDVFHTLIDMVNELRQMSMSVWIHVECEHKRERYPHGIWDRYVLIGHDNIGFRELINPMYIVLGLVSNTDELIKKMNILLRCSTPKRLSFLEIEKYNREFVRT